MGLRPIRVDRVPVRWRFALLGGGASIPFTLASYWETGSTMSLSAVFFGGLLAGFLAKRRLGTSRGVGARAGLVGGLPVCWILGEIGLAATGLAGPSWFLAAGVLLVVGFIVSAAVAAFALSILVGAVGGRLGGWLASTRLQRKTAI